MGSIRLSTGYRITPLPTKKCACQPAARRCHSSACFCFCSWP